MTNNPNGNKIDPSPRAANSGYRFGTFKGVFTPSILTILGVVMYLRLGWVLGQVGLGRTLLIVVMSSGITLLTGLSLAALATNMRVRLGGAYFIISRSLGIEAGAAVGLPLFLAQAVGIAFYLVGFAESVNALFPMVDPRMLALVTLALLALLAAWSADLALRTQYLVMTLIGLSLVSFFMGTGSVAAPEASPEASSVASAMPGWPFWAVFAVFFPAVTGIEAGLSMSGDLKNPARALPLGTLTAVGLGLMVYLAIPIVFMASGIDRAVLQQDPLAMQRVARWPALIVAGIWAAALSSAMGAILGAPRTLQALARDRVVFRFLGRGFGAGGDPRLAAIVSFAIALTAIVLGDLNRIAPVLSMFFLTSYGLLNLCAALETIISPASWRPRFPVRALFPITGFIGCLCVMLMINAGATLMAWTLVGGIFYLMKSRSIKARWGDLRRGLILTLLRRLLYALAGKPPDARSWQPNVLVLSGLPTRRWYLVELANAVCAGRGLMTIGYIVPPSGFDRTRLAAARTMLTQHLRRLEVEALVCIHPHDQPFEGARQLIQTYGLGPLVPNTVFIGQSRDPAHAAAFGGMIRTAHLAHKNMVIVRDNTNQDEKDADAPTLTDKAATENDDVSPRIDIWWGSRSPNLNLMLALTVLLQRGPEWTKSNIIIKMVVESEDAAPAAAKAVDAFLKTERIPARTETIVAAGRAVFEIITASSDNADLVLLGIRPPDPEEPDEAYGAYCNRVFEQTGNQPLMVLILTGEAIPFAQLFDSAAPKAF